MGYRTELFDEVEYRSGDLRLRAHRHRSRLGGGDDRDLVLLGVESDVGARDVVDHDRVEPLALELPARALDGALAVLGGEPDQDLLGAPLSGDLGKDVLGRLELEGEAGP